MSTAYALKKQTQKNKNLASAEPSASCLPDTFNKAQSNPHHWLGSDPTTDMVVGRNYQG